MGDITQSSTSSNNLPNGQSSPGNLQSGQHPSKAILHIPQFSSLATHLHVATAVHLKEINRNSIFKHVC